MKETNNINENGYCECDFIGRIILDGRFELRPICISCGEPIYVDRAFVEAIHFQKSHYHEGCLLEELMRRVEANKNNEQ